MLLALTASASAPPTLSVSAVLLSRKASYTAPTSIGGVVCARLLCSFGCGAVMVFVIETRIHAENKNTRQPSCPRSGVGRHRPAMAGLIRLPPHSRSRRLAVPLALHFVPVLSVRNTLLHIHPLAAAPTRGSGLFYLHPRANTYSIIF